jgi:membrane protein implicated in regulation of membrane protease activity
LIILKLFPYLAMGIVFIIIAFQTPNEIFKWACIAFAILDFLAAYSTFKKYRKVDKNEKTTIL